MAHSFLLLSNLRLCLALLLAGAAAGVPTRGLAQYAVGTPPMVAEALDRYQRAWEQSDVLALLELGAGNPNPFAPFVDYARLDEVRTCVVQISSISVTPAPQSDAWDVEFDKVQEELLHTGAATRGISRIMIRVVGRRGTPAILEHRLVGSPDGGTDPYASANPRTWRGEHTEVEKAVADAYRRLLESDWDTVADRLEEYAADPSQSEAVGYLLPWETHQAQIYYFLSVAAARLGNDAAVEAYLESATRFHPEFPLALNELAHRAMSAGRLADATRLWSQSLSAHPRQQDVVEQLRFVQAAIDHFKDEGRRARFLQLRGTSATEALSILGGLLREDRTNPELRRRMAAAHLQRFDADAAEKALLENEYYHPEDLETQYLLGRTYLAMDRVEDALQMFARVWERNPGYRDTIVYLAELNAYLRRYRAAINYLREGLTYAGEDARILYKLGVYLMRTGRRFEALSFLRRASSAKPPAALRQALFDALEGQRK